MKCPNCKNEIDDSFEFCPKCGTKLEEIQEDKNPDSQQDKVENKPMKQDVDVQKESSPKSRLVAALLSITFGWVGAQNLYLNKKAEIFFQILISCIAAIASIFIGIENGIFYSFFLFYLISGIGFYIIDFFIILCGKKKDSNGLYLKDWRLNDSIPAIVVTVVFIVLNIFVFRFSAGKTFEKKFYDVAENGSLHSLKAFYYLMHVNDDSKDYALYCSAAGNNEANLNFLLRVGANPNDYGTILACACKGSIVNMRRLIDAGADVNRKDHYNQKDSREGQTALMYAASNGYIELVKILIENGADINAKSEQGFTALYLSAGYGKSNVLKYLIEQGANINIQIESGYSPLMIAAQNNHMDSVQLLLDNGANILFKNKNGEDVFEIDRKSNGKNNVYDIATLLYRHRRKVYGY